MTEPTFEREALRLFEALLDAPEADRDAWLADRTAGRPDLAARVAALVAGHERAVLRTGSAIAEVEEESPPDRIGAYRIAGRIGRGGMGSVYRGERDTGDFSHTVAIKIIKPGLMSDALVERFQRERQTLAALSHRNIAQLYDGGETEGGSPYFVMELVDGLPLLDWIADRQPDRAGRLRLFLDICDAVAFANRNLIVHRDLTPSNVLVTRDGVVKLIDFGIAKPVDAASAATSRDVPSIVGLSLTPGYAAPERLVSAEVSIASDIFSLGKLLEKMLPPRPADRELTAIIARATAPDPADRYPTADALAADVAAWHGGFPVSAVPQGGAYVTRKFVMRHPRAVGGAAVALVALLGALTVTLLANARAEAARIEAERRFQDTRSIARVMLFDAYDEVSRAPGSTRARALLARTGLKYLNSLTAGAGAPLDVRVEAARGYVRLAQVTGGGQQSTLGRFEDSNALLARAERLIRELSASHPDDPSVRRAHAALLAEQSGVNLYNNNDPALARRQAQEGQRLMQPIATADVDAARLYALALQAEGDTWLWDEDFARARATHERAERFIAGLPPAIGGDVQVMAVRSANLRLLAEAQHELHDEAAARATLDRAVAVNRDLVRALPGDPLMLRKLVISLRYRAIVHRTNGRHAEARESIVEALNLARGLRDRDATDVGALQLFTVVGEVYSEELADMGRFAESYAIGDEALGAYRRMVDLAGNTPGALRSMAQAVRTMGDNHRRGGDLAGACRHWRDAQSIVSGLDRRGAVTAVDRNGIVRDLADKLARDCRQAPAAST